MEWIISKSNKRKAALAAAGALFGALLAAQCSRALQSEPAAFDPASVQAASCREGGLNCGYVPLSGQEASLIEPADSFYLRPRGLPERFDLTDSLPPVGNQGQQNSCLGWSLGYGLKSYYEKVQNGWDYDPPERGGRGLHVFSPAFIYNQINGGEDRGATPREALQLLMRRGASPWAFMPYREDDFKAPPPAEARSQALAFRLEDFRRVSCSDPFQIKTELSRGNPVMIGVRAHMNFYTLGAKIWENHEGRFFGGHAVILSGYDDDRESELGYKGAFRIYNSFGKEWGEEGLGWVAYDFLPRACLGAYVLHEGEVALSFNFLKRKNAAEESLRLSAPVDVQVSRGVFADRIELRWKATPAAISYRVERDDGAGFETIAVVDEGRYRDTKIRPRIAYAYRIVSIGAGEESDPGRALRGYARAVPKDEAPGPVWHLRGDRAERFVQLDWERAQGAREHEIARWDPDRGEFRIVYRRGRSRFRDRRPRKNEVNYYRVRGVNRHGKGAWSEPLAVRVAGPNVAPGPVSGLTLKSGADRIELEWLPVEGALRYRLLRRGPGQTDKEFFTDEHRFVDSGTTARSGEILHYSVKAVGRGGSGPAAGPVSGRTAGSAHRGASILPPTEIEVVRQPEQKRIFLSWKSVRDAAEYRVYRKRGQEDDYTPIGTVKAPGNSFSAPLFGGPGTLYFYTIRSRTAAGVESAASRPVSGLVRPPLSAPREVYPYNGGLQLFTGRWSAFDWEAGKARRLELFVSYSGRSFQANLLADGRRIAGFTGDYIARDRILAARDFRMELDEERPGNFRPAAQVFFRTEGGGLAGKEIVFVRDVR